MSKCCIYCSARIDPGSVVDICQKCMYQVWGEKMARAIVENMEKEKNTGNLELGRVSETDVSGNVSMEVMETDIVDDMKFEEVVVQESESLEGLNLNEPKFLID